MSYAIKILDHGLVKGNNTEPILIKPNGISYFSLPIEIKQDKLLKTGFDMLKNKGKISYTLSLNANIKSGDLSQKYCHTHISQTGKMELKK